MTRRCSHCSNNGHNSRTCPTRATTAGGGSSTVTGGGGGGGVKLFGVRLTDGSFMKKSASMGNLSHYYNHGSSSSAATSPVLDQPGSPPVHDPVRDGYLSDDPTHHVSCSSSSRRGERKKGKPWTEEEHRLFLIGLQKLGKGDWRGIARSYVVSRTPTQVASHAQKYFIRQSNSTRRKRRSSLFDMVPDMVTEEPEMPDEQSVHPQPEPRETDNSNTLPSLDLSLGTESEPMEATSTAEAQETQDSQPLPSNNIPLPIPAFFVPIPYPPIWQQNPFPTEENTKAESVHHQVLKPTPVHLKEPVDVDHLMGMSQLNLSETENGLPVQPQVQLSLNILGAPSRQSAFHASAPSASSSELKEGKSSVIPAA